MFKCSGFDYVQPSFGYLKDTERSRNDLLNFLGYLIVPMFPVDLMRSSSPNFTCTNAFR